MQIARPQGAAMSKALPHTGMIATTGAGVPGTVLRSPPLRSTSGQPPYQATRANAARPEATVMRDEEEYINWLKTNS